MPKLPQYIEERFDVKRKTEWHYLDVGNEHTKQIKSFIAIILNEERERIINKIKDEKSKLTMKWDADKYQSWAFDSIINLIKEDEKTTKDNF